MWRDWSRQAQRRSTSEWLRSCGVVGSAIIQSCCPKAASVRGNRSAAVTTGAAARDQARPFQCSTTGCSPEKEPLYIRLKSTPAAQMSVGRTAATPAELLGVLQVKTYPKPCTQEDQNGRKIPCDFLYKKPKHPKGSRS